MSHFFMDYIPAAAGGVKAQIKIGDVEAVPNTTGTHSDTQTNVGTPDAVLAVMSGTDNGANSANQDAQWGFGFTDGVSEYAHQGSSRHNQASTTNGYRGLATKAILQCNAGGTNTLVEGDWSAWTTDGITYNFTTIDAGDNWNYIPVFFSNFAQCVAGSVAWSASSTGITETLGWEPDVIMLFGGDGAQDNTKRTTCLGFVVRDTGTPQMCFATHEADGSAAGNPSSRLDVTKCFYDLGNGISFTITISATGFTITPSASCSNTIRYGAFKLQSGQSAEIKQFDSPNSAASDWTVNAFSFKPQSVIGVLTSLTGTGSTANNASAGAWTFFGADDDGNEGSVGASVEYGSGTTDAEGYCYDRPFLKDDAGTTIYDFSTLAFNSAGWTVSAANITTASTTTHKGIALAISE